MTRPAVKTQANGGFHWGVEWSIDGASGSTYGLIVQHVVLRQNVKAWLSPLEPGHDILTVEPGQNGRGGLSTSWYPIWEAWPVRGGMVFVGEHVTGSAGSDFYGQTPVGENTKGTTELIGRADFFPNLTLPAGFTVRNTAPAWSVPMTTTDPGLTGGTGALDHDLTATWDGINGDGATTATTV